MEFLQLSRRRSSARNVPRGEERGRMFSQASVLHADRKVDVSQTCQQSVFSPIGACMRIWLMHSGCRGTADPNVCLPAFSLFPLPSSPLDQRPCSQANDGMGWVKSLVSDSSLNVVYMNMSCTFILLLCRSMKLWNAVHIMSSIGRIA